MSSKILSRTIVANLTTLTAICNKDIYFTIIVHCHRRMENQMFFVFDENSVKINKFGPAFVDRDS